MFSKLRDKDESRGFVYPFPKNKLISSGPGGQNAAKRNTKIYIEVNVSQADWISYRTKASLSVSNKLTKSGDIIFYDQTSRSQEDNKKECLNKLYRLLLTHSYVAPEPTPEEIVEKERHVP